MRNETQTFYVILRALTLFVIFFFTFKALFCTFICCVLEPSQYPDCYVLISPGFYKVCGAEYQSKYFESRHPEALSLIIFASLTLHFLYMSDFFFPSKWTCLSHCGVYYIS